VRSRNSNDRLGAQRADIRFETPERTYGGNSRNREEHPPRHTLANIGRAALEDAQEEVVK
jgi:hypothetical protein